jgi:hypothetical protein
MCADAPRRWLAAFALIGLALAPAASVKSAVAERLAADSGRVSKGAARAAVDAAERVEREMAPEGANRSRVRGCWRNRPGVVDCTAEVRGDDGSLVWRCVLQIRIRKREAGGYRSKLRDAVCVVHAVSDQAPTRRSPSGG